MKNRRRLLKPASRFIETPLNKAPLNFSAKRELKSLMTDNRNPTKAERKISDSSNRLYIRGVGRPRISSFDVSNIEPKSILPALSAIRPQSSLSQKTASRKTAAADITYFEPKNIYPQLNQENLDLSLILAPARGESTKPLNDIMRWYSKLHALFGTCIDFHALAVLGQFAFTSVADPGQRKFWEKWADEIRLYRRIHSILHEYFLLAEAYPYAAWNEKMGYFDDLTIIDPDSIVVTTHYLLGEGQDYLEYIPDERLKQIITKANTDPAYRQLLKGFDPQLISAVRQGRNLKLSNFNVDQIARKDSEYDLRGTPIGLRCLKDLILEDSYRVALSTYAKRHADPTVIFKLGEPGKPPVGRQDIDAFAELLDAVSEVENRMLVTHQYVNTEVVAPAERALPLDAQFERIRLAVLTAFFLNDAVLRGEGPGFSGAPSVAMRALNHMYSNIRSIIEEYLRFKIFTPIATAQGFYAGSSSKASSGRIRIAVNRDCKNCHKKPKHSKTCFRKEDPKKCLYFEALDKSLLVPKIEWVNKLNLLEERDKKDFLLRLNDIIPLPVALLARTFEIDPEELKQMIQAEKGTWFDPNIRQNASEPGGNIAPLPGMGGGSETPAEAAEEGEVPVPGVGPEATAMLIDKRTRKRLPEFKKKHGVDRVFGENEEDFKGDSKPFSKIIFNSKGAKSK